MVAMASFSSLSAYIHPNGPGAERDARGLEGQAGNRQMFHFWPSSLAFFVENPRGGKGCSGWQGVGRIDRCPA